MTVESSASPTVEEGSGRHPPAAGCRFAGLPCTLVRAALLEPAEAIAERANAARRAVAHQQRMIDEWLAARGLRPTGDAPRPRPAPP